MNAALYRSAFSPIIYEGRDSAVALLDERRHARPVDRRADLHRQHRRLREARDRALRRRYRRGRRRHHERPVSAGHASPRRHRRSARSSTRSELVGFAASRAHWQDIGAIDAGSTMGSTSIFHEGIRLGPTRIVQKYKPIREWFDLLTPQHPPEGHDDRRPQRPDRRDPHRRAAARPDARPRRRRRLSRAPAPTSSSRRGCSTAQAIAAMPDGTYTAKAISTMTASAPSPVKVALKLTIDGDRMIIDLDGSSGPVEGSINCGAAQTVSMIRLAYKAMINPDARDHRRLLPDARSEDPGQLHLQRQGAGRLRMVFHRPRPARRPDDHLPRRGDAGEGDRRELRRLDGRRLLRHGSRQGPVDRRSSRPPAAGAARSAPTAKAR